MARNINSIRTSKGAIKERLQLFNDVFSIGAKVVFMSRGCILYTADDKMAFKSNRECYEYMTEAIASFI